MVTQAAAEVAVVQQKVELRRQFLDVLRILEEDAVVPVLDDLSDTRAVADDHGHATRHGFENGKAEGLVRAREDADIGHTVDWSHLALNAEELDVTVERSSNRVRVCLPPSLAHDDEHGPPVWLPTPYELECVHDGVQPLPLPVVTDEEHDGRIVRDAQGTPLSLSVRPHAAMELPKIDAVGHDEEAILRDPMVDAHLADER